MSLGEEIISKFGNFYFGEWYCDETGVYKEQSSKNKGEIFKIYASPIPLIPTAIIENVDSKIEKNRDFIL